MSARIVATVAIAAVWCGLAVSATSGRPPPGASSCSGCHAASAAADTAVPRLAGRKAADIVAAMRAFKTGEKASTVMGRIAKGFTDVEVEAIAAWYAQQEPQK
jgi:cytochrome c553